jgi:RNA polymerase sigma-70 factor (ECF subfamily)
MDTNKSEAIDILFDKYFALLVIYAKRFVHSYDAAEDIVQEIFLKLWEKEPGGKFTRSYLFSSVHNSAINHVKKSKGVTKICEDDSEYINDYFTAADEAVEEFEKLRSLFKALDKLPPKTLDVLKRVYLEEKQYSLVAREMGLSLNTVKAHMYLAIKSLRKYLLITWLFALDFFYSF